MEFDHAVSERRSVRKFKKKVPDWRDILDAIEAARQGPSAGAIHATKFILVDDPEIIADLAEASEQEFVADAHYVVVVVSDGKQLKKDYRDRAERYSRQQAGAAIEQFMLKLVDLGLGSCWVGLFVDDHVRRALKIPDEVDIEAVIPVGYSSDKSRRPNKPNQDSFIYFNEWNNPYLKKRKVVEAR